jgi:hypothetical protein
MYKVSINPIIQSRTRLISHAHNTTRDNIILQCLTLCANIHGSFCGNEPQFFFNSKYCSRDIRFLGEPLMHMEERADFSCS